MLRHISPYSVKVRWWGHAIESRDAFNLIAKLPMLCANHRLRNAPVIGDPYTLQAYKRNFEAVFPDSIGATLSFIITLTVFPEYGSHEWHVDHSPELA
jgi:hypothetical protein